MGNSYAAQTPVSAAIDVDRIRSVLRLTQEQERYWRPVEAALRNLARHQERAENRMASCIASAGIWSRSCSTARPSSGLAVAARPLIAKLDDRQKQAAGQLAQEMGLGPVVMAALN